MVSPDRTLREFKYVKCLLRHEKKAHDLDLGSPFSSNDEKCDDEKSSKDEESKVDGVYDYGCQTQPGASS